MNLPNNRMRCFQIQMSKHTVVNGCDVMWNGRLNSLGRQSLDMNHSLSISTSNSSII